MRPSDIQLHTTAHGTILLPEAKQENGDWVSSNAKAAFRLEKIGAEALSLFRVRAELTAREDQNGSPVSFRMESGVEFLIRDCPPDDPAPVLSIYQHKPWWIRPGFRNRAADVPDHTQLVIGKADKDGEYIVFLAVCGDHARTDISGSERGLKIAVSSFSSGTACIEDLIFGCGTGRDPFAVTDALMQAAIGERTQTVELLGRKRVPEWTDRLGWCTWDSLGQDVNEKAIFEKMDELAEKQVPIGWVLIDDGWSEVDPQKKTLKSFFADPEKFPLGLAHTVRVLKEKYHVRQVGVWQAFKGYWNGVEPYSQAWSMTASWLQQYGNGEWMVRPDEGSSFGFWNTWHSILRSQGIDFVKVDGQSSLPLLLRGANAYMEGIRGIHDGLEASVCLNFDGALINCMGMGPESMWSRKRSSLVRTSDDFLPCHPGSFYAHALQNVFSNVLAGSLYTGDFDMFWSRHKDARVSAVLRAVSGGPVYVSDAAGRTDEQLLSLMTADDGTLLKADTIARPSPDCLLGPPFLPEKEGGSGMLKVISRYRETVLAACFTGPETGAGDRGCETGTIVPSEITGNGSGLVYNCSTGEAVLCGPGESCSFEVPGEDVVLLELIPVNRKCAVAGFTEKLLPAAGVVGSLHTGSQMRLSVNCHGPLAFWSEKTPVRILAGEGMLEAVQNGLLYTVNVPCACSEILIEFG